MSKPSKVEPEHFPWQRCLPGESFFVPSLDPYTTMLRGRHEAVLQLGKHARVRCRIGIHNQLLGVLFTYV